jgi:hypothetical protein
MTPARVAAVLLAEEAEAALGERLRGLDVEIPGE